MIEIQSWLEAHGLGRYAQAFAAQDVSVDLLSELSEADLKELGMASLGDRKRLLRAVAAQQALPATQVAAGVTPSPNAAAPAASAALPPGPIGAASPAPDATEPVEEAERRHATVMFSDLTGYTALNEAFDPEEVEAVMGRIKQAANQVIERHGGRVNQFVGDEVMAMFGVPVARRDDPRHAVAAALELHQVVDGIAAGLSQRLGRRLSMHTGIQTGLVIARRSDSRAGDYTLTGDTVNTAARLRGLAGPGELVVSPQTWQQVSDWFEGEAGAPVEVKGKERPLVPWRILADRVLPRAGSRPLVGRADEMQQFDALVQASRQRQRGRVIFVRGDPGMGKSRLVAECQHVAREAGLQCHATSILDFGARTGHDAIRTLAQSLLGLEPDADIASRSEAIAELGRAAPDNAGHRPFLYDLLDLPAPPDVHALLSAVDAQTRQKATLDALCALVRSEGATQPALLLVEDIHWADAATLTQLAALAALTTRHPLLLLMTTRFAGDPSVGDWRTALHGLPVTSIDLGPLESEDALRLAAGAASMSEALLRSCVERAEGNPLFLEQLLLNAGDEGAASLPGSIQALIQARMDRLSAQDKAALQAAAVWGPRVPLQAIRHLLGDASFDPRLLIEQFLLRPEGDELVFSHALFRDGAYGSLLHARRRLLHQMAADWIEPRDVALAAEHYERAEDVRAVPAYLRASEALARGFKYADALRLVERGLKLADASPHRFALRLARAQLLLETGRAHESVAAANEAVDAARDDGERARALIAVASGMRIVDRSADGLAMLELALPLAERAGLMLELSTLHHLRGNLLFGTGRTLECRDAHERALALAREAGSVEAEANALGGVADACYAQGRVRTAHEVLTRCVALARQHGLLRVEVSYLTMLGWTSMWLMGLADCLEFNRACIELAQRVAHRRTEMMASAQRGLAEGWYLGNTEAALPYLDRALEIARALGSLRFEAVTWTFRAMAAIRQGDPEAARAHVATGLERAGEGGRAFVGPQLYSVLARVETDPAARARALAEGEAALGQGAVSHGYFMFYDAAIESSLQAGQWDLAEHYCGLLEAYTAAEPFAWSEFTVARGRALCRAGRGETGPELASLLRSLKQQTLEARNLVGLAGLDQAIARASA